MINSSSVLKHKKKKNKLFSQKKKKIISIPLLLVKLFFFLLPPHSLSTQISQNLCQLLLIILQCADQNQTVSQLSFCVKTENEKCSVQKLKQVIEMLLVKLMTNYFSECK